MRYNKKTNEYVFKLGKKYLLLEININRWGIPFYIARHWSGVKRKSYNTSYCWSIFCFHFTYDLIGPIIKN